MNRLEKYLAIGSFLFSSISALGQESEVRLLQLKDRILSIAIANGDNRDNLPEIRDELEPLVQELSTYQEPAAAIDQLDILAGAWKEVWSDDIEPEPPGFTTDRDRVYQVITRDGYFYNIGGLRGPLRSRPAGYLRGVYRDAGINLAIEFTRVGFRLQGVNSIGNLLDHIKSVESGATRLINAPGNTNVPNGPVGATGTIRNIYIDQDLRIATGQNDADGIQDLYILTRVDSPVEYREN